jgi:hypothetical protein
VFLRGEVEIRASLEFPVSGMGRRLSRRKAFAERATRPAFAP